MSVNYTHIHTGKAMSVNRSLLMTFQMTDRIIKIKHLWQKIFYIFILVARYDKVQDLLVCFSNKSHFLTDMKIYIHVMHVGCCSSHQTATFSYLLISSHWCSLLHLKFVPNESKQLSQWASLMHDLWVCLKHCSLDIFSCLKCIEKYLIWVRVRLY